MKPTEPVSAAPAGAPLAGALAQRCATFLAPFLTPLDRQLDARLVRTPPMVVPVQLGRSDARCILAISWPGD